jgi:hypothetical protein
MAASGAPESFCASDETEAKEVAGTVYEACSDVFYGYELWCGPERVAKCGRKLTSDEPLRLSEVVWHRQGNILDLEDRLQNTFSCIRESRKLLAATAALRASAGALDQG